MKNFKKFIAIGLVFCILAGLSACTNDSDSVNVTHMILNADGSFGGSISEELYGKGAPLNGEYNVKNSDYYTVNNDFYNMPSTKERVIIPKFASYQQTMQDSSGLACLVMILNYMGEDVKTKYSELELLKQYEKINNEKVYGKGTTEKGLISLIDSLGLGYTAYNTDSRFESGASESEMKEFLTSCITEGKFVLARYQSPVGYGWKIVIGYDDLGNVKSTITGEEVATFGDDVVIFAEPYDGFDHCQDGYATERAKDFYAWRYNKGVDGRTHGSYSFVVVDPNLDIEYEYQPVDETVKQTLYDIHLPLNPDGTYGGSRDVSQYGTISSGRGWFNHTESNYYKINDFYNMGNKGSRVLLKNYTVLQQTMSSSCGICAVGSVLKYYGRDESFYDLELLYLNQYEDINDKKVNTVSPKGTSVGGHSKALKDWGYMAESAYSDKGADPVFSTYEAYFEFMHSNLKEGRPVVVSTHLGSGHYLTVIGVDDMGTDYIYDDVIIVADSSDYWDGYQDGYNVYSAYKFFSQHFSLNSQKRFQYVVIYDNK